MLQHNRGENSLSRIAQITCKANIFFEFFGFQIITIFVRQHLLIAVGQPSHITINSTVTDIFLVWRKPDETHKSENLPPYKTFAKYGAPRRSRTLNLQIRSLTLYPIELWAHISISTVHYRESIKTPIVFQLTHSQATCMMRRVSSIISNIPIKANLTL